MQQGYIKLFRSLREHWLWKDPIKLQWWIDLLMEVNHAPQKVNLGMQLIECKRGQTINSLLTYSKRWKVDQGKVRRFFDLLESDGMIKRENVKKTTRITICNYDDYNSERQDIDKKMNHQQLSFDTQTNTNKNGENEKNEKKRRENKLTLFRNSKYFDKEVLATEIAGTKYDIPGALDFYHDRMLIWSDEGKKKKIDWSATFKRWLSDDQKAGTGFFKLPKNTSNGKAQQSLNLPDHERQGGWSRLANEKAVIS